MNRRWQSFDRICNESAIKFETGLELGVGTGIYIERASRLFKRLILVDGSKNMLEILDSKIARYSISNVDTIQADATSLNGIGANSVDCVYFFGLIEHIVNIDLFVKELKRVLRPEGVVIGVTPNGNSPWYWLRSLVRGTGKHCSTDHYYTLSELNRLFKGSGFEYVSHVHWGLVPAGLNDNWGKLLSKAEPLIEKTPLARYLGGLTFSYRLKTLVHY